MFPLAIAIEIGGTKVQAALGERDGKILARERGIAPASEGAQAILAWFDEAVPKLLNEAKSRGSRVDCIGVGFGGPVETATG